MYLPNNINHLRRKLKLSQEQLAEKINKSSGVLSSYEKGRNTPPLEVLLIFTKIFDVTLDDLVNKDLENEPSNGRYTVELASPFNEVEPSLKETVHLLRFKLAMYEKYIRENAPEWMDDLGIE